VNMIRPPALERRGKALLIPIKLIDVMMC
jgi:hypothetical protein